MALTNLSRQILLGELDYHGVSRILCLIEKP